METSASHADRYLSLIEKIKQANHEYHALARPTLTDAEYDMVVREARALEEQHPELRELGGKVTGQVGAPTPGAKVKHKRPMLSLDNVFSPDELRRFFKTSYRLVWEPKIDGLSLSLTYASGRLVRAVTRGDGTTGDDVTHNALVIPSIPKTIPVNEEIEVRGEVYIESAAFESIVKEMEAEGDEPFANARNAAAGSLKLKDSEEASKRKLSFIAYHGFGLDVHSQTELCRALVNLGFHATSPIELDSTIVTNEVMDAINAERQLLPYETDGVVFKINEFKIREELGLGSKSPKWGVAYKFPPEEGIAKLLEIKLQVGRTGTINPVAVMSPVQLNGATVTRASLCNFDEIKRLDIAVGDEVVVVRAAEVIPKVIRVHKKADDRVEIAPPTSCPCCGATLFKDPELVAYVCQNLDCKEQAIQRLEHAVCKSCLDWDGFGKVQVAEFVERGYKTLSDAFNVSAEELVWLKPAAKKKFLAERERVKTAPLWRKLHALGLDGIGKSFCQDLAFKYGDILKLVEDYDGVAALVGPNRAHRMFQQLGTVTAEIERLDNLGFHFTEVKKETAQTGATGKIFVITGTLVTGTRDAVSAKIEQAGGVVKGSVTKATNYLVVGEAPGNNKTQAATKYGTKVISEEELYAILGLDFAVASNPLDGVNVDDL